MREVRFNPGEVIIQEDSFGDSAYILKQGTVEVRKKATGGEIVLATIEASDIFGELGLVEDKPRSATIIAKTSIVADEITRADFIGLLEDKQSFIIPILRAFFERLRQTNNLVVQLENKIATSDIAAQPGTTPTVRFRGITREAQNQLNDKEVNIKKFPFKIGRKSSHTFDEIFADNDLYIEDEIPYNVSKNHLSINFQGNQYYVLDRGSSIGTIVNGTSIGGKISNYKVTLKKGENTLIIGSENSPYQFIVTV
jgi:CRP/FNR family cyclic AMP-dependent transcriptional regulator